MIPILATLLLSLIVVMVAAWGALALWYQLRRGIRALCATLWMVFGLASVGGLWWGHRGAGVALFALAHGLLLIWWRRLTPSNDRDWTDDVAQTVRGKIEGTVVTLDKVRDFDWRSETDYTPRWTTRSYDLTRLRSLDMIVSYWARPSIAHMLISFGFGENNHVVFSVEIRRQKHQTFSEIGGFFKEFELIVIAAHERDIVRLRTNVRREDTYLFRMSFQPEVMRALFLAYVAEANALAREPRFYHTITGNCTTVLYRMLKRIVRRLPFSYRVLLSGYMPEYFYGIGYLDQRYPLEELRTFGYVSERGRIADESPTYSADMRLGIPLL
ncbi:MAG: DUF4105 domain-containing protein [Steroidobacteraceae bacterium]